MDTDLYAEILFEKMRRHRINPDCDRLDQHFLISSEMVGRLVDSAGISERDFVLEIGPGIGQISEAVLQKGAKLISIEIDTGFKEILAEIKSIYHNAFDVIWGSALDVDWPVGINKIVMSPPFSILEPLLEKLYCCRDLELISMVIGRRYYENASQRPGSRGFSKSALMTQAKFKPTLITEVRRECFYPTAGERSVIMTLTADQKPNPVLRKLAEFFIEDPQINLKFVLMQVLELLNKRAKKYRKMEEIVTAKSLGLDNLLNKRLQDLGNSELSLVVQRLTTKLNQRHSGFDPRRSQ